MTDKVAGRVAFRYNNQEGYLKNIYPYAAVGAGTFGASDSNSPPRFSIVALAALVVAALVARRTWTELAGSRQHALA